MTPTTLAFTEEIVQSMELDGVPFICSVSVPSDVDQHHQTTRTNAQ